MTDGSRAEDLLADRPGLEAPLQAILSVDEHHETWTFDDVGVDSGAFGQLVSEGVVEKADGEYRLADPDAVRRALSDDPSPATETGTGADSPRFGSGLSLPQIDSRAAGLLGGVLALVVVVRSFIFGSVFRDGTVVLSANDPYYYRYWVEQAIASGDIGLLPFGAVPDGIDTGEPFLVALLAWASGLLGGVSASGAVLAVYPVVAALAVALGLYGLTIRVTADRRVALASVLMLAVTPTHALRSSLGFADHHAFDYVWLLLTALSLAILVAADREDASTRWLAAGGLGVGIAGQVLAWDNGPLLVVPVGLVLAGRVLLDVREGRSPLGASLPTLVGLALAAVVTFGVHATVGWHSLTVAATPALLLAGGLALVAVGEAGHRLERGVRELAVGELAAAVLGLLALRTVFPDYWSELLAGIDRIVRSDNIVEVQSLFDAGTLGFLLLFGFILVIALPVLAWATGRLVTGDADEERWLVPAVYGWYFFGLALFQVRFAGELSPFTALFAGLAFVWLAAKIDAARPPATADGRDPSDWLPDRPDRSTVLTLFALFLLVGGLSVVQSGVKVSQVATDDSSYNTAAWLAEYADERGWDAAEESYVLSSWGKNRLYNYFVNGDSQSYGYARQTYGEFIRTGDPQAASEMLGSRVRFVVVDDVEEAQPQTMQARLHRHFGSRNGETGGVSHFRALFASDGGQKKAFVHVSGATLSGTATPNATLAVASDVDVPGASFTYQRQVDTNATGAFSLVVPYPGDYELTTDDASWRVTVSEEAVMNGTTVAADP